MFAVGYERLAPQVGLEPTTLRLTAISSPMVGSWSNLYLYGKNENVRSFPTLVQPHPSRYSLQFSLQFAIRSHVSP
jgi:hypothetical protein